MEAEGSTTGWKTSCLSRSCHNLLLYVSSWPQSNLTITPSFREGEEMWYLSWATRSQTKMSVYRILKKHTHGIHHQSTCPFILSDHVSVFTIRCDSKKVVTASVPSLYICPWHAFSCEMCPMVIFWKALPKVVAWHHLKPQRVPLPVAANQAHYLDLSPNSHLILATEPKWHYFFSYNLLS